MNQNSSSNEWHLHIAIVEARKDTREAPWYGPWNIVLRDFLFTPFCSPPFFTITYPQFPVSKQVDTDDADDDDYDDSDYDDDNSYDDNSVQMPQSPSPLDRSAAPSPEIFRSSRSLLPLTPPKPPAGPPPPPPPKKRTTRIPDFLQLLYKIACNPDGTIPSPIKYRNRIILLVEVKKLNRAPTLELFADIEVQTAHQARHAFYTSPDANKLGVILAIGHFWKYIEYHRTDLRPSPSFSEKKDPTYKDATPPPPPSIFTEYPPFVAHVGRIGFLCLETKESNQGLAIVRKRLQDLNLPRVCNN